VGRVLLAPFRALGPKLNAGLTTIEEKNALEGVRVVLSNPYIHPLFGTLGDGSGFGGGVALSTADGWSKNYQGFASFHGTFKKYVEVTGGLRLDPTGGNLETFSLELAARYRKRPEEDFWGLGPNSLHSQRSTYELEEPGFSATASYRLGKKARVGALLDYTRARIGPGLDTDFPTTQDRFAGAGLPGLFSGADLLGYGVFAELDLRDVIGNPRSGFYALISGTSNDSVGDEDFGFWNYRFDTRGYLPLGSKRRVLALRMLGDFNNPKGGSTIPFFRLSRLGDTQTLRGYDTYRFHGRHALMGSTEYRYALSGGVEAFAFTDVGQVFDFKSEFNTDNLRVTYGGGLRFATAKSLFLRLYAARGGERTRLFFSFGPSF
jgi:outer membrane protein assembly factor BamA